MAKTSNLLRAAFSLSLLLWIFHAQLWGTEFLPKTDNEVVCLDLAIGKEIWSYRPPTLSDAHFELYASHLAVYPHYEATDRNGGSL